MADLSKFAIGCISDEKYIPLLKSFLSSIASNSPNVTVYITLVDCKQYESELRRIFPRLDIKHDSTDLSPKRKNLVRYGLPAYDYLNRPDIRPAADGFKGPRWLVSDRACYCSNIRYRVILEMMKKEYDPILFMDVDAIVRKDLYDLGKAVMCHDISIMKEERGFRDPGNSQRFAPPDGIDWHCGIIGVKNNNICESNEATYCKDCKDSKGYHFCGVGGDCTALCATLK